ncbi:MAG: hypothetical protein H7Z43_00545 [Clostridia bacterium]|nr:hypothetical protein [Deltaproteobacteria bacterium]
MLAPFVGVDRTVEADVGRGVAGYRGARLLGKDLRLGWRVRETILAVVCVVTPAVVERH